MPDTAPDDTSERLDRIEAEVAATRAEVAALTSEIRAATSLLAETLELPMRRAAS